VDKHGFIYKYRDCFVLSSEYYRFFARRAPTVIAGNEAISGFPAPFFKGKYADLCIFNAQLSILK